MTPSHGADLMDGAATALADERALLRQAFALALEMSGFGSSYAALPCERSRVLSGTPDQVRPVRHLVRECLAGHPSADEAILVASELATNSVTHSASGQSGGQFLIYAAVAGERQAVVIVTDQGGPFQPGHRDRGQDDESGRGLAVIRSLTSLFRICDHASGHRSFIAIISADQDANELDGFFGSLGAGP